MTNLLIKLFVKNNSDVQATTVRAAYGKLSGWVGIACNILLCAGRFLVGLVSGSVSVTADAANNLADASSSIISLLGFKLSEQGADEEHPYGHARYEYISGFIIAVLVTKRTHCADSIQMLFFYFVIDGQINTSYHQN